MLLCAGLPPASAVLWMNGLCFFDWVGRETFNRLKGGDDWRSGLVKTCWSFGNNQIAYLFGKDVEPIKKQAHDYLMANGYDGTAGKRQELLK